MKLSTRPRHNGKKHRRARACIVCAVLLTLMPASPALAATADDPLFAPPFLSFDAGSYPWSAAIGDLNGDGKLDLAVGCWSGDGISLLLGNGDGTFQARVNYPVQYGAPYVAIGDVNLDGQPDVVVGEGINYMAILLGVGDGTLAPPTYFNANPLVWSPPPPEGHSPTDAEAQGRPRASKPANLGGVAIGDLNGDGMPDVAVVVDNFNYGGFVQVMLGNGDGTFRLGAWVPGTCYSESEAMRDLNGDGWPDLALASCGAMVILNQGNGSLGSPQGYPVGTCGAASVAVGDLDRDGHPDLAVGDCESKCSVLLGNGDGSFRANGDFETGYPSVSMSVGDLDGDGILDLATADRGSSAVTMLIGNGDGTFGAKSDYGTGSGRHSAAIGDLNGDGNPDLVVANYDSNTVTVLLNRRNVLDAPPGSLVLPKVLRMLAPRPNPSRSATQIRFILPAACVVGADLFDAVGRKVRSLGLDQELPPGEHLLLWDGLDSRGIVAPDGVYLVRMRAGQEIALGKVVRLR